MKLGISSYCLRQAMVAGEMSILDVIEWIAQTGGEHVEIVPVGFDLLEEPQLIEQIARKAKQLGIDLSNYCARANFVAGDASVRRQEIDRVKREVDVVHRLGVRRMRHDVASRPIGQTSILRFQEDLPMLADACREIAEYAGRYGITTSVENHGYYVQSADRVRSLVHAVGRDNYRTTLDVGNFLCVDEDPLGGVSKNIPLASMVHLKDFYIRRDSRAPGREAPGWLRTAAGGWLRGSIFGQGDLPAREIVRLIKTSGYDGYISIEFEGLEECRMATQVSFENARRFWSEAGD